MGVPHVTRHVYRSGNKLLETKNQNRNFPLIPACLFKRQQALANKKKKNKKKKNQKPTLC